MSVHERERIGSKARVAIEYESNAGGEMKATILAIGIGIMVSSVHAQEGTAEQLVAGMDKADMSYRQLMEIMGVASGMMHEGILRQNKQMVQEGAETILTHPAPNHVPWEIMPEEHQKGFKASLVKFDRLLDRYTEATAEAAAKGDWPGASQSLQDLNTSCVTCHAAWKDRAR